MLHSGMHDELYQQWKADEQAPFEGWDFSYLRGRMHEESPPWDYIGLARELVKDSSSLLDIATGGGEVFARMSPFPGRAVAAEGWPPNIEVARNRLAPLGVEVVGIDNESALPFADASFDLIVNRHGGYDVAELYRLLQPGGQFFSQQVSGDTLLDLLIFFDSAPKWPHMVLPTMVPRFQHQGFAIERAESWQGQTTFSDVGALAYYLKAIPWLVNGFSVASHRGYLEHLQQRLEREGALHFADRRYLIHVRKPE